jgi:hypothetical protein
MLLIIIRLMTIVETIVFYCGLKMHSANITCYHVFMTRDSILGNSVKKIMSE